MTGWRCLGCLVVLLTSACDDEVQQSRGAASASVEPKEAAPKPAETKAPPPVDFQEAEFAESERSRDPFRSFIRAFVEEARGEVKSQREVILEQYSIDELKLIGLVTRVHPARAMLVDPRGVGHVVQRGQFVGRPEVIQTAKGVGASYEINWRIDRIREGDVVLIREDPSNPDVPSATRVLPLRPDGDLELEEALPRTGS